MLKHLHISTGWCAALIAGVMPVVTGCDQPKITSYHVPKEKRSAIADTSRRARPSITWTLPPGWKEAAPGEVNLAAFNIEGDAGKNAQVTIAALPFLAGREGDIVNLWRGQLGLSQLDPERAREQLRDVAVNDETGKLFELSSGGSSNAQKIVTVMIHRPGASWFYKLSGEPALVEAQRPTFLDFIKSVRISDSPADAKISPDSFAKVAPRDWEPLPPGEMQSAKFNVPIVRGATGVVSVSVFDSESGGTLAVVNRWRGQIGLKDIPNQDLPKLIMDLDPKLSGAILVNMTNSNRQLMGAVVRRGSQWFFYKLIGNPPAIAPQQEAFVRFAASEPKND